jgi:hypothetical protein
MKTKTKLAHIQVYDPKAYKDILTYGPREIAVKILLNANVDGLTNACQMNKRMREICNDDFRHQYFDLHTQEILEELEKIIPGEPNSSFREDVSTSQQKFYRKWSRIAGKKWNPSLGYGAAIINAAKHGRTEAVRLLLEDDRVNPADDGSISINVAAKNGRIEVVKLLLEDPRVDPTNGDRNFTIKEAAEYGHNDVVELLKRWYKKHGKEVPEIPEYKS